MIEGKQGLDGLCMLRYVCTNLHLFKLITLHSLDPLNSVVDYVFNLPLPTPDLEDPYALGAVLRQCRCNCSFGVLHLRHR